MSGVQAPAPAWLALATHTSRTTRLLLPRATGSSTPSRSTSSRQFTWCISGYRKYPRLLRRPHIHTDGVQVRHASNYLYLHQSGDAPPVHKAILLFVYTYFRWIYIFFICVRLVHILFSLFDVGLVFNKDQWLSRETWKLHIHLVSGGISFLIKYLQDCKLLKESTQPQSSITQCSTSTYLNFRFWLTCQRARRLFLLHSPELSWSQYRGGCSRSYSWGYMSMFSCRSWEAFIVRGTRTRDFGKQKLSFPMDKFYSVPLWVVLDL